VPDYIQLGPCRLAQGDCRDVMRTMPAEYVHSIVTDPPYGLEFMGKGWDRGVPGEEFWQAALRVAKPGAHLLAFGGTRTFHRLACAIEDAGWEIRDCIMWVYGSGFPKSLDVSKAIDKEAGAVREVIGRNQYAARRPNPMAGTTYEYNAQGFDPSQNLDITAPATDAARQWQGWGTALKPAWEPIIVARKPLAGTVAQNVQQYGTGGINVDGCRVAGVKPETTRGAGGQNGRYGPIAAQGRIIDDGLGRFPANIIHDGSEEVLAGFPNVKSGVAVKRNLDGRTYNAHQEWGMKAKASDDIGYADSGSAARFFYCAKASTEERGAGNAHPTVKPVELMRYLVRLVTVKGGIVLDPFMGSGSTLVAAVHERCRGIGIDLEPQYYEIALQRVRKAHFECLQMLG
jgi:DNA modification methylase